MRLLCAVLRVIGIYSQADDENPRISVIASIKIDTNSYERMFMEIDIREIGGSVNPVLRLRNTLASTFSCITVTMIEKDSGEPAKLFSLKILISLASGARCEEPIYKLPSEGAVKRGTGNGRGEINQGAA